MTSRSNISFNSNSSWNLKAAPLENIALT